MSRHTFHDNKHSRRLRRGLAVVAIGAAMTVGGGALLAAVRPADPGPIDAPTAQAPVRGLADLVEAVRPAVVSIVVEGRMDRPDWRQHRMHGDRRFRDFFEQFFGQFPNEGYGQGQPPVRHFRAAGSGFIISADGYVVTNNHVVGHADEISVILRDGTKLAAKLRGTDPKTDLALLKVDTDKPLPYVEFGNSEAIRVGDWVVAIGNPFGLGGTVTAGIVSARSRDANSGPYNDYLQIDAPINKGNSGGPLFDLQGKVVGINTAIFSPNGGNVGIGFAIPSNDAKTVIASLMDKGYVARGKLGVEIQTVTPELAEGLGLDHAQGVVVSKVTAGSPAARAGIQVGDIIVNFDSKNVDSADDLAQMVAAAGPHGEVNITVLHQGEQQVLNVTLEGMDQTVATSTMGDAAGDQGPRLGAMVAPVNDRTRARFELPQSVTGAVVIRVQPGSAAARAGLRPGDVIRRANGNPVESAQALAQAVDDNPDRLVLLVNRSGNQWFLRVQPDTVS